MMLQETENDKIPHAAGMMHHQRGLTHVFHKAWARGKHKSTTSDMKF